MGLNGFHGLRPDFRGRLFSKSPSEVGHLCDRFGGFCLPHWGGVSFGIERLVELDFLGSDVGFAAGVDPFLELTRAVDQSRDEMALVLYAAGCPVPTCSVVFASNPEFCLDS